MPKDPPVKKQNRRKPLKRVRPPLDHEPSPGDSLNLPLIVDSSPSKFSPSPVNHAITHSQPGLEYWIQHARTAIDRNTDATDVLPLASSSADEQVLTAHQVVVDASALLETALESCAAAVALISHWRHRIPPAQPVAKPPRANEVRQPGRAQSRASVPRVQQSIQQVVQQFVEQVPQPASAIVSATSANSGGPVSVDPQQAAPISTVSVPIGSRVRYQPRRGCKKIVTK